MSDRTSHIILRQKMEVHFESMDDYFGVQNEIQELFYDQLLPAMDALFDEAVGDKKHVVIERMEIDCGLLNSNRWKEELVEKTLREIQAQLNLQPKVTVNHEVVEITELLFFLENGRLPWNSRIQSVKELEAMISVQQLSRSEIMRLKALLSVSLDASERLVYNFSEAFIRDMLRQFTDHGTSLLDMFDLFVREQALTEKQRQIALTILLKLAAEEEPVSETAILELLHDVKKNNSPLKQKRAEQEIEYIYVHNAGLVILHPFLPELFYQLGLSVNNKWKDEAAQHSAVRILEYLATGNCESDEFNLSLNKIMCGMPLSAALKPAEQLPATMIAECDHLLHQVIRHWIVMKNTSIDGLRETFLQRNGRLQQIASGWQLHVERTGVDILLDSLPWGIGTIVLPWTEGQIHVEWQL
jgi:hypothetical protein